ncbi:MAG: chemotaxis protein CheW [Nitrospirota bacterium]
MAERTVDREDGPGNNGGPADAGAALAVEDFYSRSEERVSDHRQVVCFRLAEQWYGIDIRHVREVLCIGQIVSLPAVPGAIVGVCQVRGAILSVTDPKRLFGLPERPITEQSRIVIVEAEGLETGLLVDAVSSVGEVADEQIDPPLPTLEPAQAGLLNGSCRIEGQAVTIIRAESLIHRSRGTGE